MEQPRELDKREIYGGLEAQVREVLDGVDDAVAAMAGAAAIIHHGLPYSSWTGFYRVVAPGLLRIGPYQGPVGCLEIPFDQGVCGAAASRGETVLVEDVHSFPGHIACDPHSRSEIVVPIFDPSDRLVAVLDLDSHLPAAFDERDREGLERITAHLRPCFARR